jgi:hypothetical protein
VDLIGVKTMDEDKGFELKCLNCESTNVTIEREYDYNYEEELELGGFYLCCCDCGQTQ